MDSVQRLRGRAQANGKLQSSSQQTVNVQTENQQQYIVIEPASPSEIYVPYYQPAVVYGEWPYPAYPPLYFAPPPGYVTASALAAGVAFGAGVAVGHAVWGSCNWGGHNINVVSNRSVNINNFNRNEANFDKWEHNPDHRHGVRYNNDAVRQKYARTRPARPSEQMRQDFRGKNGERVLDPDRPNAGNRDRPDAGERERAGIGDRERAGAGTRGRAREPDRGARGERTPGGNPGRAQNRAKARSTRPIWPRDAGAFRARAPKLRGRQQCAPCRGAAAAAAGARSRHDAISI